VNRKFKPKQQKNLLSLFSKILFLVAFIGIIHPVLASGPTGHYELINKEIVHPEVPSKKVEFFILRKTTLKKYPVIIFVHGHQQPERLGAKAAVDDGTLAFFAKQGYLAVAISQPGYGNSEGVSDYAGSYSQKAVMGVINYLLSSYSDYVDPEKIVLYGVSKGAILVGMVATQEPRLAGVILDSGFYDLSAVQDERTLMNINKETDGKQEELKKRSVIFSADLIKMPSLIMHGYEDKRAPVKSAIEFYEALMNAGSPSTLVVFPVGHHTPKKERDSLINLFLEKVFSKDLTTAN